MISNKASKVLFVLLFLSMSTSGGMALNIDTPHIRTIMLVDKDNFNYLKIRNTSISGGYSMYSFPFDGVKNQGFGQYWVFEPMYSSRGIAGNFIHGVLRCVPQSENGFCSGDPAAFPAPPAEYVTPYPATVIFPLNDIF